MRRYLLIGLSVAILALWWAPQPSLGFGLKTDPEVLELAMVRYAHTEMSKELALKATYREQQTFATVVGVQEHLIEKMRDKGAGVLLEDVKRMEGTNQAVARIVKTHLATWADLLDELVVLAKRGESTGRFAQAIQGFWGRTFARQIEALVVEIHVPEEPTCGIVDTMPQARCGGGRLMEVRESRPDGTVAASRYFFAPNDRAWAIATKDVNLEVLR